MANEQNLTFMLKNSFFQTQDFVSSGGLLRINKFLENSLSTAFQARAVTLTQADYCVFGGLRMFCKSRYNLIHLQEYWA